MYYIEKRKEYRYKDRERYYYQTNSKWGTKNLVDTKVTYGEWGDWTTTPLYESSQLDVETRTVTIPKSYRYAHYCTATTSDGVAYYCTDDYKFHKECSYHELGWFSEPLPQCNASGLTKGYEYIKNGQRYRCSNTCYRWYIVETKGGSRTEYRCRKKECVYTYSGWEDWSDWSEWSTRDPDDYLDWDDDDYDYKRETRTVYRYKEKG